MLLSFQIGFSLVNAAVACAILESISGLEPSAAITEPRYLKLVTVSSFCPFTLISVLISTGVVCHQLGLLSTDLHAVGCGDFITRVKYVLTNCDHLLTLSERPGNTGETGRKTDLARSPADLVGHEALPRRRFALFPSRVYEDLIITHT